MNEMTNNIVFLVIISGRNRKDALLTALTETGVRLINTIYGRGSVKASYIMDVLGLVPEEHKVVITCLLPGEKAEFVLKMFVEKFEFDKPNTGIAFTVPIDGLSF